MDHPASREPAAGSRFRVTRRATAEQAALGQDLGASRAMDGAVHSTAAQERGVGRVHDRMDALLGEVAEDEAERHESASRPIVRPGGRSRTFSSARRTPGTKASREVVS